MGDEDQVRAGRRLLERFQQGVGRLRRHPVGGAKDRDAGAVGERLEGELLPQRADLVDPEELRFRRDEKEVRMGAGREQPAVVTRSARPVLPGLPAKKGGGERPGGLLLPHPFLAGEEKPLGDRPRADVSAQEGDGPFLADDRGEGLYHPNRCATVPEDASEHLFFRGGGVDPDDPAGVPSGEAEVPLAHGAVEVEGLPLQPVLRHPAPLDAGEPLLGRQVEQERQAGDELPRGEPVQPLHQRSVEPPRVRLVRRRRVAEAVAQDGPAGPERRKDEPADMLGPRRLVEEKLGLGEDGFLAGDEHERADLVRKGGAAGLAGDEVKDALRGEVRREPPDLRRLAGAFDSLERYEVGFQLSTR